MDLLFEIGTEEIPPSYIRPALEDLRSGVKSSLDSRGVRFSGIRTLGTPRRLALIIEGLADRAEDVKETVFGPPADKAFDASGKPTQAAVGFAKAQGVAPDSLKTGQKGKGRYVCIERIREGAPAFDEFVSLLEPLLGGMITFPKTMRWEGEGRRFARPVRWMTLVVAGHRATGGKGERFRWAGLEAGNTTRGHRFLGKQEIKITSPAQYVEELRRNFVLADHEERKHLIKDLVAAAASSVGGSIVPDEDLLERVTFTVEYPLALPGGFSPKFLDMPREVVVTALREHQDFFSVCEGQGRLMPFFVAVANTDQDRAGKIKRGNERVLKARLDDAHFYWEQDLRDGLETMAERLSGVVWQEQLGTVGEKAARIAALAHVIAGAANILDADRIAKIKRAAYLSKADLTSNMVREKEFSSLQGLMGREYARKSGEEAEVAEAIFEHYLPRFAGDMLPETVTGSILGLADKLDTIVGCFGIGLIPTGSQDPYGLRRQAAGVVRILVEKGMSLSLGRLIKQSAELYGGRFTADRSDFEVEVQDFIKQRFQTLSVEGGISPDTVESVIRESDDLASMNKKMQAIAQFRSDQRFKTLVTAFTRAYNIATGIDTFEHVDEALFEDREEAESNLYMTYRRIGAKFDAAIGEERYSDAIKLLLELAEPIDVFFDKVMVMVDDPAVRQNRLNLLSGITRRFLQIADFSQLDVG